MGQINSIVEQGLLAYSQGQLGEAIACLSQAFSAEPHNPHYAALLAAALRRGRHLSQAARVLELGLRASPHDYALHAEQCATLLALGRRGEAVAANRRARELMKNNGAMEEQRRQRNTQFDAEHPEGAFTPSQVNIETSGACTRRCHYCPVAHHPPRDGRLRDELVGRLLDELRALDYGGLLELNYYNEPLLDERIVGFLDAARRLLPRVCLRLVSNGDRLTETSARQLLDTGLDQLRVSAHSVAAGDRLGQLRSSLGPERMRRMTVLGFHDGSMPLTDRAGEISLDPGRFVVEAYAGVYGCGVAGWLMIDYRGLVHLCCNDFHAHEPLGDVCEESLADIWKRLRPLHRRIHAGDYDRELCLRCAALAD